MARNHKNTALTSAESTIASPIAPLKVPPFWEQALCQSDARRRSPGFPAFCSTQLRESDLEILALPPQLLQLNQCSRKTPSAARSSAGLISLECATVTANSGPSSFASQNARKSFSAGKFGNIS